MKWKQDWSEAGLYWIGNMDKPSTQRCQLSAHVPDAKAVLTKVCEALHNGAEQPYTERARIMQEMSLADHIPAQGKYSKDVVKKRPAAQGLTTAPAAAEPASASAIAPAPAAAKSQAKASADAFMTMDFDIDI